MRTFSKTGEPTSLRFEAAGLRWLAQAQDDGGAEVVGIHDEQPGALELTHLPAAGSTAAAAAAFGRGLAHTHAAGAPSLGCTPPGWHGQVPRSSGPMPLHEYEAEPVFETWGQFYAEYQIRPYIPRALGNRSIDDDGAEVLQRLTDRLAAGDLDHDQPALIGSGVARLHGDLWGGNVVWSGGRGQAVRGVLIDPAAHGGHAETDLAALELFGVDRLDEIRAGYQEVSALADGWQDRIGLHQLTMLIMHAVIFGGGYGTQTVSVARRYL